MSRSPIVDAGHYQRMKDRAHEIERLEKQKKFSTAPKKMTKAQRKRSNKR